MSNISIIAAVEESTEAEEEEAKGAAEGTEPAAAEVETVPTIGGTMSRGVASMMGELGALESVKHGGEEEEFDLGGDEI